MSGQKILVCARARTWRELLLDLKRHGLRSAMGPELAVADAALDF
jgi:hypothetical protein